MAEFSEVLRLDEVPAEGRALRLEANAAQREAIARRLGVPRLNSLSAALETKPLARGGLSLTGSLHANLDQICVITLEPLESVIERPLDMLFLPPEAFLQHEAAERANPGDRQPMALDGPDVEPLEGETLDVAALVLEELSLALDPHPRKAGAVFAASAGGMEDDAGGDGTKIRPFAGLDRLLEQER